MKFYVIIFTAFFLTISLSGCSVFHAYGRWADDFGKKFPISKSAARCSGKVFCFGEEDEKEKSAQNIPSHRNQQYEKKIPQENLPHTSGKKENRNPVFSSPARQIEEIPSYPDNPKIMQRRNINPTKETKEFDSIENFDPDIYNPDSPKYVPGAIPGQKIPKKGESGMKPWEEDTRWMFEELPPTPEEKKLGVEW